MIKKFNTGITLIIISVFIFFSQFFFRGLLPIPSDTITGLYHPFRDLYAVEYPNGMPYKNFLITDPVRQLYPWRSLAIESIRKLELPLWNPYSFSGTPLLANFQNGAFYPLNLIFIILPFPIAWSVLILLQPLIGGMFIYLFLKQKKIDKLACAIAGLTFAFSGFSVSWMEWNTVVQVAIWLPLILLAKDHLLEKFSLKWLFVLIFAECCAILAGHLQILFYLWTVSISYLFLRILQISWTPKARILTLKKMLRVTFPFIPMVLFVLLVTSVQWLPTLAFINESARGIDQINWQKEGWFLPWEHLIQFIIPDFFGNPTTLNYWGTWNYGELTGYIGLVPLMLAFFSLFFGRSKLTFYFGSIFLLSLVFSLPTFLAKLPFQLAVPFLSTSQPTRLLFLTDFSLSILAGLGADLLLKRKNGVIIPLVLVGIILSVLWIITLGQFEIGEKFLENIQIVKSNLLLPTIIFAFISGLLISYIFFKKRLTPRMLLLGLMMITLIDLFRFAWKFLPFTPAEYLYPSTKVTEFLQHQKGQFRIMSTNSEIMPPNFSIMYHLETLDGYDPLYLRRYGELIAMVESDKGRVPGVLAFNRIITPHNYKAPLIDLLNVKYVLSFDEIKDSRFKKVFEEGRTQVYENTNVLPRVFFAENIIPVAGKEEAAEKLFNTDFRASSSAVVENIDFSYTTFSPGKTSLDTYTPNKIIIGVSNSGEGFLVLTDSFYKSWNAKAVSLDGKVQDVKIYRTNYNFRGVKVPKNTKYVIFSNNLF